MKTFDKYLKLAQVEGFLMCRHNARRGQNIFKCIKSIRIWVTSVWFKGVAGISQCYSIITCRVSSHWQSIPTLTHQVCASSWSEFFLFPTCQVPGWRQTQLVYYVSELDTKGSLLDHLLNANDGQQVQADYQTGALLLRIPVTKIIHTYPSVWKDLWMDENWL